MDSSPFRLRHRARLLMVLFYCCCNAVLLTTARSIATTVVATIPYPKQWQSLNQDRRELGDRCRAQQEGCVHAGHIVTGTCRSTPIYDEGRNLPGEKSS